VPIFPDALLRLFSLSAYFIPIFLHGYAVFLALGREVVHPHLKKVGGIALLFGLAFGLQSSMVRLFGKMSPQAACSVASFPIYLKDSTPRAPHHHTHFNSNRPLLPRVLAT
jgi:hypothetical protein